MKIVCDFTSCLPEICLKFYHEKSDLKPDQHYGDFISLNSSGIDALKESDINMLKMKYSDSIGDVEITSINFNDMKMRMFIKIFYEKFNMEEFLYKPLNHAILQHLANNCYKIWYDIVSVYTIFDMDEFEVKEYRRN